MKYLKYIFIKLFCLVTFLGFSQNIKEKLSEIQFEHLRINVKDINATANWYVKNLDLEIVPTTNKDYVYLSDKDHNFLIELSPIPNVKSTYEDIDVNAFHLAFEGNKTIQKISKKMIANGGKQQGDLYTNKIGDFVNNIKDPNGFNLQLLHRVNPFLSKPKKGNVRFEHFAINVPDQKNTALWFVEFMDLIIPWSKDINKTGFKRNYRVPYVGDTKNNMSLEIFGKDIECSLSNMPHNAIHIAFRTEEPEKLVKRMLYGGATRVGKTVINKSGDVIIDMYDPSGIPIRLIKRKKLIVNSKI